MKLYSRRRLKKIREVLEDPEEAAETGAAVKEGTKALEGSKARR
jgi:hypothetical protein